MSAQLFKVELRIMSRTDDQIMDSWGLIDPISEIVPKMT